MKNLGLLLASLLVSLSVASTAHADGDDEREEIVEGVKTTGDEVARTADRISDADDCYADVRAHRKSARECNEAFRKAQVDHLGEGVALSRLSNEATSRNNSPNLKLLPLAGAQVFSLGDPTLGGPTLGLLVGFAPLDIPAVRVGVRGVVQAAYFANEASMFGVSNTMTSQSFYGEGALEVGLFSQAVRMHAGYFLLSGSYTSETSGPAATPSAKAYDLKTGGAFVGGRLGACVGSDSSTGRCRHHLLAGADRYFAGAPMRTGFSRVSTGYDGGFVLVEASYLFGIEAPGSAQGDLVVSESGSGVMITVGIGLDRHFGR